MNIPLVNAYAQTESIPEGTYFVFDKGMHGCFQDEDLYRERKTKPYLVCLKTGKESHRFNVLRECETSNEARQVAESLNNV
jgi:hypothetical protein